LLLVATVVRAAAYAVGGLACGVLLAVAVAAAGHARALSSIGSVLGTLTALGGAAALSGAAVTTAAPEAGWLVAAAALIGFGTARFRLDAFGAGAIARTIGALTRTAIALAFVAVLAALIGVDLTAVTTTLGPDGLAELLTPTTDTSATAGFIVVAWSAVISLWLLSTVLPPPTAVPPTVQRRYRSLRTHLPRAAGVVLGGGSVIAAVTYTISADTGAALSVLDPTVGAVLTAPLVRAALIRLALTAGLLTVLVIVGRTLSVDVLLGTTRWSLASALTAGGLVAVAALAAGPAIETLPSLAVTPTPLTVVLTGTTAWLGPTATGLAAGSLLIAATATGLLTAPVLAGAGFLPAATAAPRLLVAGLTLAAIATTATPLVVFTAITAAVIVWDLAVFGLTVTADLGPAATTRPATLLHAATSVAVGVVTLAGITTAYRLLTPLPITTTDAPTALLFAAVAALLATAVLAGLQRSI
jgi:hypothetical protein